MIGGLTPKNHGYLAAREIWRESGALSHQEFFPRSGPMGYTPLQLSRLNP